MGQHEWIPGKLLQNQTSAESFLSKGVLVETVIDSYYRT